MKILIIGLLLFNALWVFNTQSMNYRAEEPLYAYNKQTTPVFYFQSDRNVTLPIEYQSPQREMRGVWVATVFNIDMPKQLNTSPLSIAIYKQEFLKVLETMEAYNMNTIFFQIRPANDAFYASDLNPWSQFLAGHGENPGWDPLGWMIEQTHARGFAFHAWMNAYRVTPSQIFSEEIYASNHSQTALIEKKHQVLNQLDSISFARKYPEYVVMGERDTKLILNPGEPRVIEFLANTVKEIIEKYPIDGLHFDDYFYLESKQCSDPQTNNCNFVPYEYTNQLRDDLNDLRTYRRYLQNPAFFDLQPGMQLGEFRRASVDKMIETIHHLVSAHNQENNTAIEFGSKPAAVWQSNRALCTANPRTADGGSNTHCYAYSSNYDLFADSKKWVEEGWVDYVAPQVYYAFESPVVPYADIVDWWVGVVLQANENLQAKNKPPVKLYIAHGIYKYSDFPEQFANPNEFANQLKYNQKHSIIQGSAVFAYNDLLKFGNQAHLLGMKKAQEYWDIPVLPAKIHRVANVHPNAVSDLSVQVTSAGFRLDWTHSYNATKYAIYRSELNGVDAPLQLIRVLARDDQYSIASYIDQSADILKSYQYSIQSLSQTNMVGPMVEINTENAMTGEMLSLDPVHQIYVSDNTYFGEEITIRFININPVFGGSPNYQVYKSSDLERWDLVTSDQRPITTTTLYSEQTMELSTHSSIYIKIVATNEIGYSESQPISIQVLEQYSPIRQFTYIGNPFNNQSIMFQWWGVDHSQDLMYQLEYSEDQIHWNTVPNSQPLEEASNLYQQIVELPSHNTRYFYRVKAMNEQGSSMSKVLRVDTTKYLGAFQNVKFNGQAITGPIRVHETDQVQIVWDNFIGSNINYVARVSVDLKNWRVLSSPYVLGAYLSNPTPQSTAQNFEIGYIYYKLYVKIEAISLEGTSESEVFELLIDLHEHFLEDFLKYMHFEQKAMHNRLNIFE